MIALIEKSGRSLLIIAEEIAPLVIMQLLARREKGIFTSGSFVPAPDRLCFLRRQDVAPFR